MALSAFLERYTRIIVALLLTLFAALALGSTAGDAGTVDEVAHIPSGYSYLKFGDYRLNPEHPPLIKDLAALPLLFMPLKFPSDIPDWTTYPNGQWETGWNFIYHIGNNADQILFWARLPLILLAIAFGWFLYRFAERHFGQPVAVLTLFLYALSPNIIAHSRLVTTDLGTAAFGFFAFAALFAFLKKPTLKTGAVLSVAFALAQLAKFSAVLLIPFFFLLAALAVIFFNQPKTWQDRLLSYGGGLVAAFAAAFLLIWLFYIPHTWNMPVVIQDRLIEASLSRDITKAVGSLLIRYNDLPCIKPLAQYLLGVLMVFDRVAGGNTTYFLGQVTNQSFLAYFPVTYLIKTPIPLLLLSLSGILFGFWRFLSTAPLAVIKKFRTYTQKHFVVLSSLLFIIFYSYLSITGNLNLGIRHLMPIMPFVFLLTAKTTVDIALWLKKKTAALIGGAALALLLLWYLTGSLFIYPSYIAYFNELVGGPENAYRYVSDSNVDWGQDLRRLVAYVNAHPEIEKIGVDYFGGGYPPYYFCARQHDAAGALIPSSAGYDCSSSKFVEWHAENGPFPGQYLAVSETFLMNDLYWAPRRGDMGYSNLRAMTPIAKIGYSIYVYKLY